MTAAPTPVFCETQWFARRWWWLLLGGTLGVLGPAGWARAAAPSWQAWAILLVAGVPTALILWLNRLEVRVDAAGIHYRYPPLLWRWRHWPWREFRQVFMRTYSPGAYGGWGIRGLPGDLLYNVWGRHGLQLVFASGNTLLLGTQRPDELRAALRGLQAATPTLPITTPAGA